MGKWKIDFTPYLASIVLLTVIPGLVTADQNLVTQTVYGFLDFTTTIGNTVMVFSPQSADSAASEKSKPSEPTVNTVIETKPITSTPSESSPVITPSKTEEKEEKKSSEFNKKTSTVIDAKSNTPANSKSEPKSKVNVVHKASPSSVVSAVNIVNAVTTSPSEEKSVISKVEVVGPTTTSPLIVSSKVEIEGPTSHVVATPAIGGESESSSDNEKENEDDDDEPAVILQNNIGEPEYDFLSRQPSEFVEETYKAGGLKNTRYITVTSTFEKLLEPTPTESPTITPTEPLTENILATTSYNDKDGNFLDSSIATLPPLYVASDMETPPLETKTETFSTTQTLLKTHMLPAVRDGNQTSTYTLIQTYLVTRIVTATKTLPPMEAYHFNPSRTLNEFNSHLDEAGSELNLDIAFGDEESENSLRKSFQGDLDLANVGSDFSLSDNDKAKLMEAHLRAKKLKSVTPKPEMNLAPTPNPALSPDQLQQLALLRFLNPGAAVPQGQIITTSKPVVKLETVYESHVIPIFNGQSTVLTTVSKVLGTVTRTDYELGTSTIAAPVVPALPTIAPVNPLFPPQQQPQFTITTSPIVQNTVLTQTDSKVLKLTFGAKTAYTTIFSTKVVPTMVTTYMTASVPVQPTAAFPGFFPAPYPPFPYLG